MKPKRHIWEEGSTHRAVAGKEYDEVWDYVDELEAELAGMELMDAEGEAFGETIVRENERLKAELAEKTKSAEEYHPDAVSFAKQLQQAQAERDALAREVAAMEIFINQVLNNEFAEWGKTKAYLELLHATRKEIEQERQ